MHPYTEARHVDLEIVHNTWTIVRTVTTNDVWEVAPIVQRLLQSPKLKDEAIDCQDTPLHTFRPETSSSYPWSPPEFHKSAASTTVVEA